MSKTEQYVVTYAVGTNDIYEQRDLMLRLALRTLLHKSFQDVDLDTVIDILESEVSHLRYSIAHAPPTLLEKE